MSHATEAKIASINDAVMFVIDPVAAAIEMQRLQTGKPFNECVDEFVCHLRGELKIIEGLHNAAFPKVNPTLPAR